METTCPSAVGSRVAQWKRERASELVTRTSRSSRFITRRGRFTMIGLWPTPSAFWSPNRAFPSSRILASAILSFHVFLQFVDFKPAGVEDRIIFGGGEISITDYHEASTGKLDNDKIDYAEKKGMRGILWPTWIKKLWEFYWACALDDGWIARQYCRLNEKKLINDFARNMI